jgi:hypothetical protein
VYTEGGIFDGLVLLRVLEPDMTFVTESGLPGAAKREAARLVLSPERTDPAGAPFRWDRRRKRWRPLPDDWAHEDSLRKLARELHHGDPDEHNS